MFTPLNLFGKLGTRTKNILKVIGGVLLIVRPVLAQEPPVVPGIQIALPVVDWVIAALGTLGVVAFVDKFSPERHATMFGAGTEKIAPPVQPVVDVAAVPAPKKIAVP